MGFSLKNNNTKINNTIKNKFITKYLNNVYDFKFVIGLDETSSKKY